MSLTDLPSTQNVKRRLAAAAVLSFMAAGLTGCALPPPPPPDPAYTPPFVANLNINDLENVQEYEVNIKEATHYSIFLAYFPIDVGQYDVPSYWINVYKLISDAQWDQMKNEFRRDNPPKITAHIRVTQKSNGTTIFDSIVSNSDRIMLSPWGEKIKFSDIPLQPGRYTLYIKLMKTDLRLKPMFNKIGLNRSHHGK